MAEKKKAKFSVGQVVGIYEESQAAYGRVEAIEESTGNVKLRRYDMENGDHMVDDWPPTHQGMLRPLTSREVGPRPAAQPTKRGR